MSHEQLYRIKVQAQMCLQPGMLRVRVLPLKPPPPGRIRLAPYVPGEIPLALVPMDLQTIGSEFWLILGERREVVGVERVSEALP
jgi:hypothetical protein